MVAFSVRSLVWSAFRRGGLVSVGVVACRRSPSGVALSFVFSSRSVALGFRSRWAALRPLVGVGWSVLVPVAGSVPFVGAFGPAGAHRAASFAPVGVRRLPALVAALQGALL